MKVVVFNYGGRFAHFLRAEATANALTYPIPPRTVLLGLAGAVLGLRKDSAQDVLSDAKFAVGGPLPQRFWHKANMRKNLPAPLNLTVKKLEKGSSKAEKNTRIPQEWLWNPSYCVWASFPESHHNEFADRIRNRRWHFTPCLGLSEMVADLEWIGESSAEKLNKGSFEIATTVALNDVMVDGAKVASKGLGISRIRMPRDVTTDRVFTHSNYLMERSGNRIPVETENAWQVNNDFVMFM